MAFDKIVDGAALNSRLSALADSIRAKGKTTAKLCFETGDFEKAVDAIRLGYFPTLHVTAPAGSEITVTDGSSTFTGLGTDAPVAFELPNMGTWTVKAVRGSDTAQETVIVSQAKDYTVSLNFGIKISTLPVGSLVKMKVNGAVWEWIIVHQGKPSSLYDESCNGTWLLMKDIYEVKQWSTKYNDYEKSIISSYLNGTFFNLLDANIRDIVQNAKIPYRPDASSDNNVNSGANGLASKVFLLSGYEMGWTDSDHSCFPRDGAKLAYFDAGTGSAANNKRIAKFKGSPSKWWLRSPYCGGGTWELAFIVDFDGDRRYYKCLDDSGVRPALILPLETKTDNQHNVLG